MQHGLCSCRTISPVCCVSTVDWNIAGHFFSIGYNFTRNKGETRNCTRALPRVRQQRLYDIFAPNRHKTAHNTHTEDNQKITHNLLFLILSPQKIACPRFFVAAKNWKKSQRCCTTLRANCSRSVCVFLHKWLHRLASSVNRNFFPVVSAYSFRLVSLSQREKPRDPGKITNKNTTETRRRTKKNKTT